MSHKLQPCPHMKTLLSGLLDGSLTGLARWYTENHTKRCPGCSAAMVQLLELRDRLTALSEAGVPTTALSTERWEAIEAAWNESDTAGT